MKGCGKEFVFKREVNQLESEVEGEELFEENVFTTECKEPMLCPNCDANHAKSEMEDKQ